MRSIVVVRLKRAWPHGDLSPVDDGASELRIRLDAGQVYFAQRGSQIVVLLLGGSKRSQTADIKKAKALAAMLD